MTYQVNFHGIRMPLRDAKRLEEAASVVSEDNATTYMKACEVLKRWYETSEIDSDNETLTRRLQTYLLTTQ